MAKSRKRRSADGQEEERPSAKRRAHEEEEGEVVDEDETKDDLLTADDVDAEPVEDEEEEDLGGVSGGREEEEEPEEEKGSPEVEAEEEEEEEEEAAEPHERDEETAAGHPSGRTSSGGNKGKRTEAGIIKQIYMENFMCHRKLRVDLNRNVNFIHGQNGSGKSAILAAIQICLGAGARRTHRARNLRELVRKDAGASANPSSAKIRVTVSNQGSDGFEHDTYGDTITVERCISLSGGYNGYKLLDSSGVEKSRSKKDLDRMLDTLNIQVENPVAVLDQEEAKKFLTGKGEEKYAFFMKATELERMDRTYASIADSVMELSDTNDRIKDGLSKTFDHVAELKRKWEQHQQIEKLERKLEGYKSQYAWAYYTTVDDEYSGAMESLKKFQEKAGRYETELSQAEEALSSPSNEQEEKKKHHEALLEEAQNQTALRRELEEQLKQAHAPCKQIDRQLKALSRDTKSAVKTLAAAKKRLQEARDQILAQAGSAQSEEARRTAILKRTEEELAEARSKVDELRQTQSKYLRAYEEVEPHVLDARSKVSQVSNQLNGVNASIRELESASGDSLAVFGRNVPKLHQLVEKAKKARKFTGPVAGPLGAHVKIASGMQEFALVAEMAIGNGVLDRFVVTNDHDRRVLTDLRNKAGCNQDCGIFQMHNSAGRFHIPPPPSADGIETVASVLNIENDLVFNCLVDNARIDVKAVARDKEESERHLLVNKNGQNSIRGHIKQVYLPNGDEWFVRNGALAMFSNERLMRQTLGVDRSAALAAAVSEEAQLKAELKELRKDEAKLESEHREYQRQWNRAKKAVQENDTRISDLTSKIDDIKIEMETSAENTTIDTTEYEEDVQRAEEDVERLKESESKLRAKKEELEPAIADAKSRLDDCNIRNAKVLEDITKAEQEMEQFLQTQSQQNDMVEKKRAKCEKYKEIISKHQQKIDSIAEGLEKALMQARKIQFRLEKREELSQEAEDESQEDVQIDPTDEDLEKIEPQRTTKEVSYYEARIKRCKANIEKEREKRSVSDEDPAVAYEKYKRAQNDLNAKVKQTEDLDKRIEELEKDMSQRRKRWHQFRKFLTRKTSDKFGEMLTMNDCSGDLEFDHEGKRLALAVQKGSSTADTQTKDVKALSGGERSYTTMCLLIALGETLETPFRILDEFDVFLDAEVRKLTIKSLIHVAKKLNHRQFIFITPQDLSSIKADPQLKILKLNPPERHHNAGGPTQQTLDFSQSQA